MITTEHITKKAIQDLQVEGKRIFQVYKFLERKKAIPTDVKVISTSAAGAAIQIARRTSKTPGCEFSIFIKELESTHNMRYYRATIEEILIIEPDDEHKKTTLRYFEKSDPRLLGRNYHYVLHPEGLNGRGWTPLDAEYRNADMIAEQLTDGSDKITRTIQLRAGMHHVYVRIEPKVTYMGIVKNGNY
jgi:hypothetical protein